MRQNKLNVGGWLKTICLCRFYQRVTGSAGASTMTGVGKQPGLAANGEGPYGVLSQHIADDQIASHAVNSLNQCLKYGVSYRGIGVSADKVGGVPG